MKDQKENFINDQFFELKTMLLSGCEELCNRALRYDEASRLAFANLEGKSIAVSTYIDFAFIQSDFEFQISFCESGLIFTSLNQNDVLDDPDVAIKASSFHLFSRLLSQRGLLDGDVEITGDRTLVSQVQSILFGLELDWEEPLSHITGDIFAHELGRFARDASQLIKSSGSFFEKIFNESFFEKDSKNLGRTTAKKAHLDKNEFNTFQQDVDELNKWQEKITSRANHLFSKHQKNKEQPSKSDVISKRELQ